MKKNYISTFLLLDAAFTMAGLALQPVFDSALFIGAGLGTVFLFCAIVLIGKREKQKKTH
ncbi:hypothetical protein [Exiguobacterium artemiae]|uniref:hypothetical protein n=1 Tax=Exiguobacterium artemiae TaxID=340145 RepID=UPI002964BEFE|nr:hypothetical protein [Exiguobacterium sibiricum]MDW2885291.1 hypothetical protein [Exiguobacterium sibiricum]